MPSPITHIIAGTSVGAALYFSKKNYKFIICLVLCSLIPDLDVLSFRFGIKYSHFLGHRGFSHSLLFAFIMGSVSAYFLYTIDKLSLKEFIYLNIVFFSATATHTLLDAMTNGGLGVGIFSPFDNRRYFLPWRPITVAPLAVKNYFTPWGLRMIKSEILWIWIPSAIIVILSMVLSRINFRRNSMQLQDLQQKSPL